MLNIFFPPPTTGKEPGHSEREKANARKNIRHGIKARDLEEQKFASQLMTNKTEYLFEETLKKQKDAAAMGGDYK